LLLIIIFDVNFDFDMKKKLDEDVHEAEKKCRRSNKSNVEVSDSAIIYRYIAITIRNTIMKSSVRTFMIA